MDELSEGRQWSEREGDADADSGDLGATPAVLRTLVEMIPDPAVVTEEDAVVTGNDAFLELFDRPVSAIRGSSLETLFPGVEESAVQRNCDADSDEYLTSRVGTEGADDVWVDLSFARQRVGDRSFAVGTVHDVTDHRERTWQLEEYERIVEAIEDGVFTLDESFTIETVNEAMTSMTGHDRETLVGSPATLLADDSTIDAAAEMSSELLTGERDFATLTTELETADGDSLPIETRFTAHRRADGNYGQVGVVRDISDRRRFERTLAALHDSTRDLLQAETASDVDELIVDSATEVLNAAGAAVYRFDAAANVLEPRTLAGYPADTDTVPVVDPGESPLWESFVSGDLRLLDADEGSFPVDGSSGAVCLPLGEHGLFYVVIDVDEHDADTIEVLELLAASGEAALARVDREQALRKRDERLREQNRELRQLEEVNSIIRRIDQVLVDAGTCSEIEQAVCDQLAQSQWVSFAWLGRLDTTDLEPRAWAGDSPGYLDAVSLTTTQDGGPPAVQTARDEEPTVVPVVADGLRSEPWRAEAVSRDYLSAISVPLRYDEFTYGVLTVYGTERSAFEGMLQSVFTELGGTIASAIREVESRQRRSAATATELEVELVAPNAPLSQIADRVDHSLVCEGAVPQSGDTTRLFFRVADAEVGAESVCSSGRELTRVESLCAATDEDPATLFEAVVAGETVSQALLDEGARPESVRVDTDGSLVVTVRFAHDVDVRAFVERLDGQYRGAKLTARRERTAPSRTESGVRAAVEDSLTDRQQEVFRTAYYSGFFDWPRKTSGQELAERLDVSQPTVSRHLRIAERKLLELIFGDCSQEH